MLQTAAFSRPPRVPFQRPVRVRSADGVGPSKRLWALNLSVGGMFIRSADPLPLGTRVRIEVEWAATVIPLAEAEVVWRREMGEEQSAGFGLRFTRVDHAARELLSSLVKLGAGNATAALRSEAISRGSRERRPLLELVTDDR
jgi:uncharacterized protein (TIGR02266 family)